MLIPQQPQRFLTIVGLLNSGSLVAAEKIAEIFADGYRVIDNQNMFALEHKLGLRILAMRPGAQPAGFFLKVLKIFAFGNFSDLR